MAFIDRTAVKRMVEARLQTVSSSIIPAANVYFQHQPVPGGNGLGDEPDVFIRLVAIDLRHTAGIRDGAAQDQVKIGDVVITVHCQASAAKMATNPGALSSVMAEVERVLHEARLDEAGVGATHSLDILEVRDSEDPEVDRGGQRRLASGAVVATGKVVRTSGRTIGDYV